jgi:adenylate cyclase
VGAAAAAGGIVAGVIGDEERLEYTVIGDPVNLSAKLESHTKREGARALTTRATLDAAIAQGLEPRARYRALPGRRVSGMDEPLDLVVLAD